MWKTFVALLIAFVGAVAWQYYPDLAFTQNRISEASLAADGIHPGFDYAQYYGRTLPVPPSPDAITTAAVLGLQDADRHIEIDLTTQKLYLVENGQKVNEFLISSGKWGRTPTGTFSVWYKVISTRMTGGSKALRTYYDLPRVPYTMFFYNDQIPKSRGYGVHGAYWHNNFGHPMSHGCINMRPEDAKVVYEWSTPIMPEGKRALAATKDNPGTKIVIYGTAPSN